MLSLPQDLTCQSFPSLPVSHNIPHQTLYPIGKKKKNFINNINKESDVVSHQNFFQQVESTSNPQQQFQYEMRRSILQLRCNLQKLMKRLTVNNLQLESGGRFRGIFVGL
jgi:hypothetical protein